MCHLVNLSLCTLSQMTLREWPPYLMVVYFVIAFVFWIPAIYFFIQPVTDWSVSAQQ